MVYHENMDTGTEIERREPSRVFAAVR